MTFEDIQKHMVDCEKTIEQLYLGHNNKQLNEVELQAVRKLSARTVDLIVDIHDADAKDFTIPPNLPFTKEHILDQLAYYQNKFDLMIPRIAGPKLR